MRSYGQFCPIARSLDLVGDRWVLLIVRELLIRPCRFSDLRHGLPGIASNLLVERLRALEDAGIVERAKLPAPAASAIYRLTARGQALKPVVLELARWGEPLLVSGQGGDHFAGRWLLMLATAALQAIPAGDLAPLVVELRTDTDPLVIEVGQDGTDIGLTPTVGPDLVIDADPATAGGLLTGLIDLEGARQRTSVRISGNPGAAIRFGELLGRIEPANSSSATQDRR